MVVGQATHSHGSCNAEEGAIVQLPLQPLPSRRAFRIRSTIYLEGAVAVTGMPFCLVHPFLCAPSTHQRPGSRHCHQHSPSASTMRHGDDSAYVSASLRLCVSASLLRCTNCALVMHCAPNYLPSPPGLHHGRRLMDLVRLDKTVLHQHPGKRSSRVNASASLY
jgi:hypothetical protein